MGKARRIQTSADRLRKNQIEIKQLQGLQRNRNTPRPVASTAFAGISAAGDVGGVGNFVRTAGDTMIGPLALAPPVEFRIQIDIDGIIDIGESSSNSQYTSNIQLDDIQPNTFTLDTIAGAAFDGQILILRTFAPSTITIAQATLDNGGNIQTPNDTDFNMGNLQMISLIFDASLVIFGNAPGGTWRVLTGDATGGGTGITFPIDFPEDDRGTVSTSPQDILFSASTRHSVRMEITVDIELTFTSPPTNETAYTNIIIAQDGTGGHTLELPAGTVNKETVEAGFLLGASEETGIVIKSAFGLFYAFLETGNVVSGGADISQWATFPAVADVDYATFDGINIDRLLFSQILANNLLSGTTGITSTAAGDMVSNVPDGAVYQKDIDGTVVLGLSTLGSVTSLEVVGVLGSQLILSETNGGTVGSILQGTAVLQYTTPTDHEFIVGVSKILDITSAGIVMNQDIDFATFDGKNIDRLSFDQTTGDVLDAATTGITSDSAGSMNFNVPDTASFIFTENNVLPAALVINNTGLIAQTIVPAEATDTLGFAILPWDNVFTDKLTVDNFIDIFEIATPDNPAVDTGRLYVKDVSSITNLFFRDSVGTETNLLAAASGANTTLSNLTSPTAINQFINMGTNAITFDPSTILMGSPSANLLNIEFPTGAELSLLFNASPIWGFSSTDLTGPNIILSNTLIINDSSTDPVANGMFSRNGDVLGLQIPTFQLQSEITGSFSGDFNLTKVDAAPSGGEPIYKINFNLFDSPTSITYSQIRGEIVDVTDAGSLLFNVRADGVSDVNALIIEGSAGTSNRTFVSLNTESRIGSDLAFQSSIGSTDLKIFPALNQLGITMDNISYTVGTRGALSPPSVTFSEGAPGTAVTADALGGDHFANMIITDDEITGLFLFVRQKNGNWGRVTLTYDALV